MFRGKGAGIYLGLDGLHRLWEKWIYLPSLYKERFMYVYGGWVCRWVDVSVYVEARIASGIIPPDTVRLGFI